MDIRRLISWRPALLMLLAAVAATGLSAAAADEHHVSSHAPAPGAARLPTTLPDGLSVPAGARLLGPVLVRHQRAGRPTDWLAVLSVTGKPRAVWAALIGELAGRFPDIPLRPGEAPGCRRAGHGGDFGCSVIVSRPEGTSGEVGGDVELRDIGNDVAGRYVITVDIARYHRPAHEPFSPSEPPDKGPDGPFPPSRPPRPSPAVGRALAPSEHLKGYTLLPGSAFVTQWGTGSVTGGFDVLLRVLPGADATKVGAAYARQAAQGEGPTLRTRTRVGRSTITELWPPGGAGGFQGVIDIVDQPGDADYIYYSFYND